MLDTALRRGDMDLDALEEAVRALALGKAAQGLGRFMTAVGLSRPEGGVACPKCHGHMQGAGRRAKRILTLVGEAQYTRSRYECPDCDTVRYPGDEALGLVGSSRSPGLQRQTARLGAKECFHEVAKDLEELAGVKLSRKDAERISEGIGADLEARDLREREKLRWQAPPPPESPKTIPTLYIEFDGTGVPMTPGEVAGRKGKQADGGAKTREAKLGCVFTQSLLDKEGQPIRDPGSATFTGGIETAEAFGWRIHAEAVRRGLYQAQRTVVLGDGAHWVKNQAAIHFGHAQFIVDYYHAKEHVGALCRALFDRDLLRHTQHYEAWVGHLWEGNIETLLEEARACLPKDPKSKQDARTQIGYFDANKGHMRYANYREQGLFIGSGVIEAACKNIIGSRLKQSGMKWTVRGANDIIALRCATHSRRFQDYWEQRAA